jgi:16S rRNA (cytosine967-C5)-methyltransferase
MSASGASAGGPALQWPVAAPNRESFDPAGRPASPVTNPEAAERARSPREIVHRALSAQARRFPDLGIAGPETGALEPRDAALAHAMYDAVIRRWLTLAALLETRLKGPLNGLEPKLQAVLLAGAAQLFFFDRLPDHAVIHESVAWAKRAIRPGAGAMVNAILRRMAELRSDQPRRAAWTAQRDEIPLSDGSALVLTGGVLPDDPLDRLAASTSHPRPLLERWGRVFGPDGARGIALHGLVSPPIIFNTRHARAALPDDLAPHHADGHHIFTGGHAALLSLLGSRTDIWVQDAASSAAVHSVRDLRPRLVLDLCAGQGTKTRQLRAVFPEAEVVATDTDPARFAVLSAAFAAVPGVTVVPPGRLRPAWDARADLVLLDVPCSNTGVLARRVEARYRAADSLDRLAATQRQIIADTIPLLARGATILYSTCSLEPEENEAQGAWARKWHRYRVRDPRTALPRGVPGDDPRTYADGSFSCILETA